MRTVKLVIIGNSGVGKTSFRGQVCSVGSFSKARLAKSQTTVCLWPFLNRLPFNHRYRFHHQDATTSLQPRGISDTPNLGPYLAVLPPESPHRSHDHRIPPGKSASRRSLLPSSVARMLPFSSLTSISRRRYAPSIAGGPSFARAHRSAKRKWRSIVSS
jgi:hypothetical protein